MKLYGVLTAILATTVSGNIVADTIGAINTSDLGTRVVTLSASPSWSKGGKAQTLFLQPDVEKTYTANKKMEALASGEAFLGWQKSLNHNILGQLGIALAASTDARLSGDQWEDADPDYNNYYYNYKINHWHLAAKAKLLAQISMVQPYISGSMGLGFNRAHGFDVIPRIEMETPPPPFSDKTQIAFTYTLGLGVQKAVAKNWSVGVGYEFADWGKSRLAQGPMQTVGQGLSLSHLYTHGVQCTISFTA